MEETTLHDAMRIDPEGQRTRKASPRAPLPKAPQSSSVAQRLLKNSTTVPVKRFDSADYFLNIALQKRKDSEQNLDPQPGAKASLAAPAQETTLLPPPLSAREHRLSPQSALRRDT